MWLNETSGRHRKVADQGHTNISDSPSLTFGVRGSAGVNGAKAVTMEVTLGVTADILCQRREGGREGGRRRRETSQICCFGWFNRVLDEIELNRTSLRMYVEERDVIIFMMLGVMR